LSVWDCDLFKVMKRKCIQWWSWLIST